jgi:pimeloyl-ACP methyl ester carboxylesterase
VTGSSQLAATAARSITITVANGSIAALRSGPDAAPDVLLVPGYTGSKEDFVPLLDPLATAGYRATAIDLPGQYESPGPDDPAAYTAEALGAVVCSVVRQLSIPIHLVGHSFGGLVARAAAIEQPDLFTDVVLVSSGPAAIQGLRRRRIEGLAPLLPSGLAAVYTAMQAAVAAEPGYLAPPAKMADFLRRRFLAGTPSMLLGMGDALCAEPDRVAELAATGLPLLVVNGEHDDAWPPEVQASMAVRLGATHIVVPDADHSPAVENPADTVAALLAFWS